MNEKMVYTLGVLWIVVMVVVAIVIQRPVKSSTQAKQVSQRAQPVTQVVTQKAPSTIRNSRDSATTGVEILGTGPSSVRTSVTVK